jgi:hypothetical protein
MDKNYVLARKHISQGDLPASKKGRYHQSPLPKFDQSHKKGIF